MKVLSNGLVFLAGIILLSSCDNNTQVTYRSLDKRAPGILTEPIAREIRREEIDVREIYQPGIQLTKESEGFESELYNDAANYCTIAYGHLIKLAPCDGTEPEEFQDGITETRGEELLVEDMSIARFAVMRNVNVELTDGQYAALCDFVFNVGSGNFRKSTLLKVVNADDFDQVPFQLLRWVKAGGKVLAGLKTRRMREIDLFFEGIPRPRQAADESLDLSVVDIDAGEI